MSLNLVFVIVIVYDSGVVFVYGDFFSRVQVFYVYIFEFVVFFFVDYGVIGQDGNVFQYGFVVVVKIWCFYGNNFQLCVQVVYNEYVQCLVFDIFCDDQQWVASLYYLFQYRYDVLYVGDFFIVDQDVWVFIFCYYIFGVGYEVRRQVVVVELYIQYFVYVGVCIFGFFYSDDIVFGYMFYCVSDQCINFFVVVGRDGIYLFYFFEVVVYYFRLFFEVGNYGFSCSIDVMFQVYWVGICGYVFQAGSYYSLSEDGSCSCIIISDICCFRCDFFDYLSVYVLYGVFQFNFFGYCYIVFCYLRCVEVFLDDYIMAFRAEGYFYCIGQSVYVFVQFFLGIFIKVNFFSYCKFDFFVLLKRLGLGCKSGKVYLLFFRMIRMLFLCMIR